MRNVFWAPSVPVSYQPQTEVKPKRGTLLQFASTLPPVSPFGDANAPQVREGAKVRLWKQDPSVSAIGIRTSYIHTPIKPGPEDDLITIAGMPKVLPDAEGNYLVDEKKDMKAFDSVHTFTVVRQVVTMIERALQRNQINKPFEWQWGKQALKVHPHAGETPNAYYSRRDKELKFFYFDSKSPKVKGKVYTNRSFDIVSHETGHAVLDALKPGFLSSWHPQTGGLHESFGDLTAIFTMLAQLDQCEAIVAESKANLHDQSFFTKMAEEFGAALGRDMGLRNANNKLKMSDVSTQVHEISQVFTGAVYSILADVFHDKLDMSKEDPAMTLFKSGEHVLGLLMKALVQVPEKNATYKDVATKMMELEDNPVLRGYMSKRFTEREILGATVQEVKPGKANFDNCCGTMKLPEHQAMIQQAMSQAKLEWQANGRL